MYVAGDADYRSPLAAAKPQSLPDRILAVVK